jgi:LAO/AO transport system kinase
MSLADKIITGDIGAAARLISQLENNVSGTAAEMEDIYSHTGRAQIIGITGAPGVGKSTLTDNLIGHLRGQEKTIGVIAIDPTSALTGGALLGDRVRMQQHSTDKGVFIRSLATRGWVGGLAKAAIGAIHIMDAMGKDYVLVETVGSGQVEIDIVRASDTTIVVMTPDSGDDIQMMKAGILEAVDIFVVNKADMDGSERLKVGLEAMLEMREKQGSEWQPPVILAEAVNDKGTDTLLKAMEAHRQYLTSGGGLTMRRKERARLEIMDSVESVVKDYIFNLDSGAYMEKLVDDVVNGKTGPQRAAAEIAGRFAGEMNRRKKQE